MAFTIFAIYLLFSIFIFATFFRAVHEATLYLGRPKLSLDRLLGQTSNPGTRPTRPARNFSRPVVNFLPNAWGLKKINVIIQIFNLLDYEQSLFFLGPSSKTRETRKWPRGLLKARDRRGTSPRFSQLAASPLARPCTPLTKSEEKERLLAVY